MDWIIFCVILGYLKMYDIWLSLDLIQHCSPLVKTVPMSVAQMICESIPVSYFDYENTTSPRMADILDCLVDKKVVCSPVTSTKCADVTYNKCEEVKRKTRAHNTKPTWHLLETKVKCLVFRILYFHDRFVYPVFKVPVTNCSTIDIPVPSQDKLHKQWCLFDQTENIDFNAAVRKITADTERRSLTVYQDWAWGGSRPGISKALSPETLTSRHSHSNWQLKMMIYSPCNMITGRRKGTDYLRVAEKI